MTRTAILAFCFTALGFAPAAVAQVPVGPAFVISYPPAYAYAPPVLNPAACDTGMNVLSALLSGMVTGTIAKGATHSNRVGNVTGTYVAVTSLQAQNAQCAAYQAYVQQQAAQARAHWEAANSCQGRVVYVNGQPVVDREECRYTRVYTPEPRPSPW